MTNSARAMIEEAYVGNLALRKFINTFLPALEPRYLTSSDKKKIVRASVIWEDESTHKTSFFEAIDNDSTKWFAQKLLTETSPDDVILDMCCNQGRFLRFLWEHGYRSLYGFDIMKPAVDHFYAEYAKEMPSVEILTSDAGDYFRAGGDEKFDYLITFSAALELVHPMNNIFNHMYRLCKKGAILIINEDGHAYPRFWPLGFKRAGFKIKSAEKRGVFTLFVLEK